MLPAAPAGRPRRSRSRARERSGTERTIALLVGLASAILLVAPAVGSAPAQAATLSTVLHGLVTISPTDAWMTGYFVSSTGAAQTFAEHWDGSTWAVVSTPSPGTGSDFLNQAAGLASNDLWTVGSRDNSSASEGAGSHTLIEHWDGTSWRVVPSPNAGDAQNILRGIAVVSANDIWAGGYSKTKGSSRRNLIEHWDGTSWQVVPSPNASSEINGIMRLAAVSPNDLWAVGNFNESGTPHTLTEHWDGSSWKIVPSPSPGVGGAYPQGSLLWSVAAVSANDVWAVGQYFDGTAIRTLTEHWDGASWTAVPSPNATAGENQLRGVVALSTNDVWAVGWAHNGTTFQTLVEHWDGSAWSVVASPNVGSSDNYLKPVAGLLPNDVWAAGYSTAGSVYQTLIEHWDGTTWTVVAGPNAGGDQPPTASFTLNCLGPTCNFTDQSIDPDGTITSWSWSFGDGLGISTLQNPTYTYAAAGSYTVTLTVSDNSGATATTAQTVTVSPSSGLITFSVTGYKVKGLQKADLTWSGAATANIDVYRNGSLITTTANDGAYTDNINVKGSGTYAYKVCEAGTASCSNEATIVF